MLDPDTYMTMGAILNRPDLIEIVGDCKDYRDLRVRVGPLLSGISLNYVRWDSLLDWAVNHPTLWAD